MYIDFENFLKQMRKTTQTALIVNSSLFFLLFCLTAFIWFDYRSLVKNQSISEDQGVKKVQGVTTTTEENPISETQQDPENPPYAEKISTWPEDIPEEVPIYTFGAFDYAFKEDRETENYWEITAKNTAVTDFEEYKNKALSMQYEVESETSAEEESTLVLSKTGFSINLEYKDKTTIIKISQAK